MRTSGAEDWALAATLVFAIAFAVTMDQARHHRAVAATADAASATPAFEMTITAKRLPANCKGTAAIANAADCAKYLQADAVVEMRETATAYAEGDSSDASIAR
jgi:hypothetical protein